MALALGTAVSPAVASFGCYKSLQSSSSNLRLAPSWPVSRRVHVSSIRSEQASSSNPPPSSKTEAPANSTSGGSLSPSKETEFSEIMAFSGPAPEIINGRIAMYSFVVCAVAELGHGTTVVEQFLSNPVGVIGNTSLLVFASFIPAILSGEPFGELQAASSEEGMSVELKRFNKDVELLHGRIAMIGFAGLLVVEAIAGAPTFHGALDSLKAIAGI